MVIRTRTTILYLVFFTAFALALTACGGDTEVQKGPVVKLVVGETTYEAEPYAYCWPQSADNTQCDFDESRKTSPDTVPITADDEVRFVIEGESTAPSLFIARLLDGPQDTQNLGTATDVVYDAEYEDGEYRVQVDVTYNDIEGQPANVSYVYKLNISGKVVFVPTATPSPTNTPEPTPTPTVTPSPTATLTLAPTLTPEPTATIAETPEPLGPALAVALEAETFVYAGPGDDTGRIGVIEPGTDYPVTGRSSDWLQIEYLESPNGRAWVITNVVEVTGDLDSVAKLVADEVPTIPASVLDAQQTAVATSLGEVPAASVVAATNTPVPTPMPTEASGVVVIPPTLAAVPTVAAGMPNPLEENVPDITLNVGGRAYSPVGYQYCERAASGERACIELPTATANTPRFTLLRGSAVQLQIGNGRPNAVRIEYLSDLGIPTGIPETRPGDNLLLFVVSPEAGSYILSVHVLWDGQEATYFFRVSIEG